MNFHKTDQIVFEYEYENKNVPLRRLKARISIRPISLADSSTFWPIPLNSG
jgi:hypothetical protein